MFVSVTRTLGTELQRSAETGVWNRRRRTGRGGLGWEWGWLGTERWDEEEARQRNEREQNRIEKRRPGEDVHTRREEARWELSKGK